MQQAGNPNLPGLRQSEIVVLSEKLHTIGGDGFLFCSKRCITHFGEDAVPYHPGEKACLDRCLNKLYDGFDMAKNQRKEFELLVKKDDMPFAWMRQLSKEGSAS
mmetsp:Transcript_78938/g.92268  ORF Transcript_78938/g.92268 Transcript_78938/m.92268 type:complete len:104 (-) Transcript_78938:181-492(-)|eukprot:CAMPEP_0176425966 /NCGR_PEP_ID=MMETSP0127-20121128/11678_1 /TAXON_ID=938130 /ORGANISM="Platyophrya macrostoma, Strain WH" /LENGTH=103 /DNA_ID=CAMNT_0017807177 /DNA_START=91 /DNA_END=402 /DNA_ORIENTATION=+